MSCVIPGLRALKEDHERYKDVFVNGFSRIAMKDVVLDKVTQFFNNNVMTKLTDAFGPEDKFNLLGVGVGQGQHELHFLKSLARHFTSINNVAVEPNESLLETFKSNVATWESDTNVSHWFPGTLNRFFDETPMAKCKYNLVSAIHSIYHTGDVETTFARLASMLKDEGLMIIVLTSENELIIRTHQQESWLPGSKWYFGKPTSLQVREAAQRLGYNVAIFNLDIKWDVTDLFDEQSDLADKLPDFFTQTAYFRETVPTEKLNECMSLWRSMSYEDADGRMRTSAGEEIILISK